MNNVSLSTYYRAARHHRAQFIADFLANVESESDFEGDESNLNQNVLAIDTYSSDQSESDQEMHHVNMDYESFLHCLIGKLVTTNNLSKSQMISVIKCLDLIFKRTNVNMKLPSIHSYWEHTTQSINKSYWFLCNHNHAHGPYIGQPKSFIQYQCNGTSVTPKLRNGNFFLKLDIKSQLMMILPFVSCYLDPDIMNDDYISDIRDAEAAVNARSDMESLTLTMFTDEVPASRSSKISVFPVFLMINELKTAVRMKHVIMAGIYVGSNKPKSALTFFNPIIDELRELEEHELEWTCSRSHVVYSKKFKLICVIADAPMRAYLRAVKQFNSRYACDWCKIEGTRIDGSMKFHVLRGDEMQNLARSKDEFIMFAQNNIEDERVLLSLKGNSSFIYLQEFDIVKGFSVDILHSVYLGVVKDLFRRAWFNVNKRTCSYYLGENNKIRIMDARIKSIKVTKEHFRKPRSLVEFKDWKATEFASFLLYFFPLILKDQMPHRYIVHLSLLSQAIQMVQEKNIAKNNLHVAEENIIQFCSCMTELYGPEFMTYNVHILQHLINSVVFLGPASSMSAFNSENEMGVIKKKCRKFVDLPQTIANQHILRLNHNMKMQQALVSDSLSESEKAYFFSDSKVNYMASKRRKQVDNIHETLLNFLFENNLNVAFLYEHEQVRFKDQLFTTSTYDENKSSQNSLIMENESCYIIKKIYSIEETCIFMVNKLILESPCFMNLLNYQSRSMNMSASLKTYTRCLGISGLSEYLFVTESTRKLFKYNNVTTNDMYLIVPCLYLN